MRGKRDTEEWTYKRKLKIEQFRIVDKRASEANYLIAQLCGFEQLTQAPCAWVASNHLTGKYHYP